MRIHPAAKESILNILVIVIAVAAGFAAVTAFCPAVTVAGDASAVTARGVIPEITQQSPALTTVPETADIAGTEMPAAVFYAAGDQPVTLADFKGEVLLVNLWATWCPPCVVELPSLDTLQAKLRDRKFRVIAISMDRAEDVVVTDFLAARHIEQLAFYRDRDRDIAKKWVYGGLPVTYLIGRDGKVITRFDGPRHWHEGPVFEAITAALD